MGICTRTSSFLEGPQCSKGYKNGFKLKYKPKHQPRSLSKSKPAKNASTPSGSAGPFFLLCRLLRRCGSHVRSMMNLVQASSTKSVRSEWRNGFFLLNNIFVVTAL